MVLIRNIPQRNVCTSIFLQYSVRNVLCLCKRKPIRKRKCQHTYTYTKWWTTEDGVGNEKVDLPQVKLENTNFQVELSPIGNATNLNIFTCTLSTNNAFTTNNCAFWVFLRITRRIYYKLKHLPFIICTNFCAYAICTSARMYVCAYVSNMSAGLQAISGFYVHQQQYTLKHFVGYYEQTALRYVQYIRI